MAGNSKRRLTIEESSGEQQTLLEKVQAGAVKFFKANLKANQFKKEADSARKQLFKDVIILTGKKTTASYRNDDGDLINLSVFVEAKEGNEVDVVQLRKLVDDATFMKIVDASQKAVEEHAGKAVLMQCLITKTGNPNVQVVMTKD